MDQIPVVAALLEPFGPGNLLLSEAASAESLTPRLAELRAIREETERVLAGESKAPVFEDYLDLLGDASSDALDLIQYLSQHEVEEALVCRLGFSSTMSQLTDIQSDLMQFIVDRFEPSQRRAALANPSLQDFFR